MPYGGLGPSPGPLDIYIYIYIYVYMDTYILFLVVCWAHSLRIPVERPDPKQASCAPNGPKLEPA